MGAKILYKAFLPLWYRKYLQLSGFLERSWKQQYYFEILIIIIIMVAHAHLDQARTYNINFWYYDTIISY